MKSSELYQTTLTMVCELTELTSDDVLRCKNEVCTDARCVLVACLSRYLTDTQIASYMQITRQGVCHLRHLFTDSRRFRWSVGANAKEIRKELESITQADA